MRQGSGKKRKGESDPASANGGLNQVVLVSDEEDQKVLESGEGSTPKLSIFLDISKIRSDVFKNFQRPSSNAEAGKSSPKDSVETGRAQTQAKPLASAAASAGGGCGNSWTDVYYDEEPFHDGECREIRRRLDEKILPDLGAGYDGCQKQCLKRASDYHQTTFGRTIPTDRNLVLTEHENEVILHECFDPEPSVMICFLANHQAPKICDEKSFPKLAFKDMISNPDSFFQKDVMMFVLPTDRKSAVHPEAPTLMTPDVHRILKHDQLFGRYKRTVLAYLSTVKISCSKGHFTYTQSRDFYSGHFAKEENQKRMCRILRSLKILKPVNAVRLLLTLQTMIAEDLFSVSQGVLALWIAEVEMSSTLAF
jgi:hypothetical protein